MYPRFSDLIQDIVGVYLPLPFSTFGVILACSFLVGCFLFALELWRKEQQGLIHPLIKRTTITKGNFFFALFKNSILGFFIGYKVLGIIFHYDDFVNDTFPLIFSLRGNLWGGLVGAFIGLIFTYFSLRKHHHHSLNVIQENIIHPYQQIGKMALMATIFCFIGARLFYYVEHIEQLIHDPIASLTNGGLNIYGGLIFGGGYIIYFIKREGLDLLHFGDACAPALMLAYGIARTGCHLSGDGDWGIPNDAPMPIWLNFLPDWLWAYDYPNNALGLDLKSFYAQLGYVSISGKAWPTPLYEFFICFLFFLILWNLRKNIKIPGLLFSIYLLLNGLERYTIEIIRLNPTYDILGFRMTMAQMVAIILMWIGVFGIGYFNFKKAETEHVNAAHNSNDAFFKSGGSF